jgi:hypothetical protein
MRVVSLGFRNFQLPIPVDGLIAPEDMPVMDYQEIIAINLSQTAAAMNEALGKYMDWDVYYHGANDA